MIEKKLKSTKFLICHHATASINFSWRRKILCSDIRMIKLTYLSVLLSLSNQIYEIIRLPRISRSKKDKSMHLIGQIVIGACSLIGCNKS